MPIGPYDKRLTRSRCTNCALHHSKCSAGLPCTNCRRNFLACQYPPRIKDMIALDNHRCMVSYGQIRVTLPVIVGVTGEERFFREVFEFFIPNNHFSGSAANWHSYLSIRLSQCCGHSSALAGLGALILFTRKGRKRESAAVLAKALELYQRGITFLQSQISEDRTLWNSVSMLSVALLLSLFELIYDTTGEGWNAHMGFGTSVLLNAFGPVSFRSPYATAAYREIRLFEISRAALFSQPTILADPHWRLHDEICRSSASDWSLLELAFDLFLQCAILNQRANVCVNSSQHSGFSDVQELYDIAQVGQSLAVQLFGFASTLTTRSEASETAIAWMYFHALSIYLSGIFDYTLSCRESLDLKLSLDAQAIMLHVDNILNFGALALKKGQMSTIFLLVPLRIAGNRCSTSDQCQRVLQLICKIEDTFAVARAFKAELAQIWSARSLSA